MNQMSHASTLGKLTYMKYKLPAIGITRYLICELLNGYLQIGRKVFILCLRFLRSYLYGVKILVKINTCGRVEVRSHFR